tara:strand:+ start:360 stop:1559 length:1200 start_codon:yes stop_codon:yes gene_type:complete
MTDTKCPLLWDHLHISLNGNHSPCCHSQWFKDQGPWKQVVWGKFDSELGIHSKDHKLARQQMREGKRVPMCEICYRREDKGLSSPRLKHIIDHKIENRQIDYNSEPTSVYSFDLKFDRTCNLGCRMCNPYSSSFLNKDLDKIKQSDRFAEEETEWDTDYQQDDKLELAKNTVANGLKVFKTTGGEPFLQRHFIEFVDWCIENNYNSDLSLRITTNLTLLNQTLLDKLFLFKHIAINVSCDAIGDTYEYIRYPAKWQDFDSKWQLLKQKVAQYPKEKVDLSISTILQIYNLFDLDNLNNYFEGYDWQVDEDLKPDGTELSVANLPKDTLQQWLDTIADSNSWTIKYVADYISAVLKEDMDEYLLKEFVRKTNIMDNHRKQSYTCLNNTIVDLINTYNNKE